MYYILPLIIIILIIFCDDYIRFYSQDYTSRKVSTPNHTGLNVSPDMIMQAITVRHKLECTLYNIIYIMCKFTVPTVY